ncbi:MAG: hypothetical protein ABS76_01900 [Pelagibacterium sp. SCN 64-44]|nr:MAG: hypothetical protein ABS76_01900 [Pelagibacterium sp. SCN 64-44]
MKTRTTLKTLRAPLVTTALVAAGAAAPTFAQDRGGVMNILARQLPSEMGNIKTTFAAGTSGYIFPVVETLVGVDPETGFSPTKLATAWKVADDGLSINFTLREGVKFHDGTDFNAEAVKWNIDQSLAKGALDTVESVSVDSDYSVTLHLKQPDSTLFKALSWYDGIMISPASVEGQTAEFVASHIVGTGPFTMENFEQDAKVEYVAFDGYWDEGKPYLDGITYTVVPDQNTAKTAFLAGQAHVWDYMDSRNAPELRDMGYTINITAGLGRIMYPDSVNADSPYSKLEVRQAFEHAIDKHAIVDAFGYGTWSVMDGPCADIHVGCDAVSELAYDPALARDLLAKAGYPNGFETTVYAVGSVEDEMMTAIQAFLADAGITANMLKPDPATGAALHAEGWNNAMYLQGLTTDGPSFAAALSVDGPVPVGKAPVTEVPERYNELLAQVMAATDAESERALSAELAQFIQDEMIYIPMFVTSRNAALGKGVHSDLEAYSVHFWNPAESWIEQK